MGNGGRLVSVKKIEAFLKFGKELGWAEVLRVAGQAISLEMSDDDNILEGCLIREELQRLATRLESASKKGGE